MNKLIMMVGLVGSGKSHYAKIIAEKENATIVSSDKLRIELFGDVNNMDNNGEVFNTLHKRVKDLLKSGKSVVIDATNLGYNKRIGFLEEVKKIKCCKECYLIATPYEKCLEQNSKRDRKVPEHVIKRMYESITIPQMFEGWDNIHIIYNIEKMEFDINELFNGENGLNKIDQENPHHTLTIGEHCRRCNDICDELVENDNLVMASLFHDIGKRFTKEFKDSKGEISEMAHYFNHEFVSAYDCLFYLMNLEQDDLLMIIEYITFHMRIFDMDTEKAKRKFIRLVGQEVYNNLLILHEADVNAK